MHSAIVVFEPPDEHDQRALGEWRLLVNGLRSKALKTEGVEMLAGNCWLLRANDGLSFLADSLCEAESRHIHYKVLFLKKKPEWVYSKGHPDKEAAKTN